MRNVSSLVLLAGVAGAALLLGKLYSAAPQTPVEPAADQPPVSAPREMPPPPASRPAYATVRLAGVPHIQQKPDFCGEACAAMVLAKLGHRINQDDVFDQAGLDPELGRGCLYKGIGASLDAHRVPRGERLVPSRRGSGRGGTGEPFSCSARGPGGRRALDRLHTLRRHAGSLRAFSTGPGLRLRERRGPVPRPAVADGLTRG